MRACTFFGHRDAPEEIQEKLTQTIEDLIVNQGIDTFYMGSEGKFDAYARKAAKKLVEKYPNIRYNVVLAYMPSYKKYSEEMDFSDTMVFDGIEKSHPKYAIALRNEWLTNEAGYAITYIKYAMGGAYKYAEIMRKKGKVVINLADL